MRPLFLIFNQTLRSDCLKNALGGGSILDVGCYTFTSMSRLGRGALPQVNPSPKPMEGQAIVYIWCRLASTLWATAPR